MSPNLSSLLMMLEAAERERDDARAELEAARQRLEGAQRQAQSLHDWRRDYQSRWQSQFRQSGGMEIMRCYQDFMQRLGAAVQDQDVKVDQASAQMARSQAALLERERKVAAITQLMERRQSEWQRQQDRQEQKATDELAARLHRTQGWGGEASGPPTVS